MANASKISIDGISYNLRDNSKAPNTVFSNSKNGLVPKTNSADSDHYLCASGNWKFPIKVLTISGTTDTSGAIAIPKTIVKPSTYPVIGACDRTNSGYSRIGLVTPNFDADTYILYVKDVGSLNAIANTQVTFYVFYKG